jgi:NADH-quinone oxidoreductase subunit H
VPALAGWFEGRTYALQIARLDAGLLVVFAFGGMTIIGAMLAGWSSNNKFSLLGAIRAGSQMISYEVVMGLTVLGLILIYATVDLGRHRPRASRAWRWASSRVGHRLPAVRRDPLHGRRHRREQAHPVRPPGSRERAHLRLLHRVQRHEDGPLHVRRIHRDRDHRRALHHPLPRRLQPAYMDDTGFVFPGGHAWVLPHALVVPLQLAVFLAKVFVVCSFQILVRWSLPRFRYDQLLAFAWKFMFPLALANLAATAVALWLMERA